jgi:hypothetical protein
MDTSPSTSESWRTLERFPLYEVSDMGNIRKIGAAHNLKPAPRGDYDRVKLYYRLNGRMVSSMLSIHRLVAEAFIPNPQNLPGVDHLNWNTRDNRACNLRWCSSIHNSNNYRQNRRGQRYEYIDVLPDDAVGLIRYGEHMLRDVYYSPHDDVVYIWNGRQFKHQIPYLINGSLVSQAINLSDMERRKVQPTMNKIRRLTA